MHDSDQMPDLKDDQEQVNEAELQATTSALPSVDSKSKRRKGIVRLFRKGSKQSKEEPQQSRALDNLSHELMDDAAKRRMLLGMK